MQRFPFFHAHDPKAIIGIFGGLFAHINHYRGREQMSDGI